MIYEYDLEKNDKNPQSTTLKAYIMHGEYHLLWKHWMIAIFHLREIEGEKAVYRKFPAATHEIIIAALGGVEYGEDAEIEIENNIVVSLKGQKLHPLDLSKQIGTLNDDQALRVFEKFVQGIKSPDSDFRQVNCQLIDSIVKFEKNVN